MDTIVRTDYSARDPNQLGCIQLTPNYHAGLRVWHPIHNESFPNVNFDKMQARECVRLITTNGIDDDVTKRMIENIMRAADGVSTVGPTMKPEANPSNYMNDNHAAGEESNLLNLMEYAGVDTVVLWQTWHIITGGWDSVNYWPSPLDDDYDDYDKYPSRHAIGREKKGLSFSHIHFITFKIYENTPESYFMRVWKDGVTCGCDGPAY